ncbi:MAG: hypothetical protein LBL86_00875 [Coriobacteriales bacterium]|jgi:hypothetical protein|nr:hypothetical protein [Coriobacteriales bacterium]
MPVYEPRVTVWHTALKHGLTEHEVKSAYFNAQEVYFLDDKDKDRRFYVGLGENGTPVELVALNTDEGVLIVHAMKPARKHFVNRLDRGDKR